MRCHGGVDDAGLRRLDGNYDLSRYSALLRGGTDRVANVRAADASSRLLTRLDPADPANAQHWDYLLPPAAEVGASATPESRREADWQRLRAWILEAGLRYSAGLVHPPGWVYPSDRSAIGFHGGFLRANRWDTTECKTCHGDDLRGAPPDEVATLQSGAKAGSCYACHSKGVEACTTCHGDDLRSGPNAAAPSSSLSGSLARDAHTAHLDGAKLPFAAVRCEDCHVVPTKVSDLGHLAARADQRSDLRAEVTLSPRAQRGVSGAGYDAKSKTCAVSCHGAGLNQPGVRSSPSWDQGPLACGDCHPVADKGRADGTPAHYGGSADCAACHRLGLERCTPSSASSDCFATAPGIGVRFTDAARHGDGTTLLGNPGTAGTCYGCHGTAASQGAPAPDLSGSTLRSRVGVGAHAAHLTAGVACSSCHVVPTALTAPGHIDSDLPAEVRFDALASGGVYNPPQSLAPTWDRQSATCSNVYCHSLPGAAVTSWSWTQPVQRPLACNSCHGAPPTTTLGGQPHPNNPVCPVCHSSAYRSDGTLDPTRHNNGRVDR